MPMIVMTTRSSTRVKPCRNGGRLTLAWSGLLLVRQNASATITKPIWFSRSLATCPTKNQNFFPSIGRPSCGCPAGGEFRRNRVIDRSHRAVAHRGVIADGVGLPKWYQLSAPGGMTRPVIRSVAGLVGS